MRWSALHHAALAGLAGPALHLPSPCGLCGCDSVNGHRRRWWWPPPQLPCSATVAVGARVPPTTDSPPSRAGPWVAATTFVGVATFRWQSCLIRTLLRPTRADLTIYRLCESQTKLLRQTMVNIWVHRYFFCNHGAHRNNFILFVYHVIIRRMIFDLLDCLDGILR